MARSNSVAEKHRKARNKTLWVSALGVAMLILGIWATTQPNLGPASVWLITLVIFGPVTVFLAIISYYTFLENIEEDKYLAEAAR